ncbi:uncharacterized protein KY384_007061 [Bacidia gigantensis]|uniref:uncharacterized protein n=1 Tax=Bacidia gigantensis TaxID=2732470 RepID=UPI001D04D31A|nr:uncharacterized protein KY384_007061 [Bacidia gigantensis]KAG8528145.1 hypothetical protein KY384_007061 [Bacidia gigantensis]
MSSAAHSLARRALDVTQQHYANIDAGNEEGIKQIAIWGMILLWATVVLYMAMISAIDYTYGDVVGTLAMIENPTATAYASEAAISDIKDPLLSGDASETQAADLDIYVVKNLPITRKLRSAVKHLTSIGGPLARFRGLHIAIIYNALHALILGLIAPRGTFIRPFMSVVASVALSRIHMTWTHVVISMPSSKSWWRRIPSVKAGKHVLLPAAIWAAAQQMSIYVPGVLLNSAYSTLQNPNAFGGDSKATQKVALVQAFMVVFVFLATVLLVVIPAEVSLKRVEASMLAEEDESIVSFDRSFDGKVKPEALGGSGSISMLDAWKTFGKEARIRLLKLYAKIVALQIATAIMFTMVLIGELKLITGGDFEKLVETARKSIKGEL